MVSSLSSSRGNGLLFRKRFRSWESGKDSSVHNGLPFKLKAGIDVKTRLDIRHYFNNKAFDNKVNSPTCTAVFELLDGFIQKYSEVINTRLVSCWYGLSNGFFVLAKLP